MEVRDRTVIGKWIYFRGYEGIGRQLYRCPAAGGDATLLAASQDVRLPIESSDGKWLYILSSDSNMTMLALDRLGLRLPEHLRPPPLISEM